MKAGEKASTGDTNVRKASSHDPQLQESGRSKPRRDEEEDRCLDPVLQQRQRQSRYKARVFVRVFSEKKTTISQRREKQRALVERRYAV